MTSTVPMWSNVSTIFDDVTENSLISDGQASKIGSEVISSSSNLRNVYKKMATRPRHGSRGMTTSSVKNNRSTDTLLMPPPSFYNKGRTRRNTSGRNFFANKASTTVLDATSTSVLNGNAASTDALSTAAETTIFNGASRDSSTVSHSPKCRVVVFTEWRVVLNKDQLLVKGTLIDGRAVRSKPVKRRLGAARVVSIFQNEYRLEGNLVDKRNELPDYVRGKFCNGFPDDWKNICQLWKSYIDGGCSSDFHWPTSITDSDDDLKSDVTEVTYSGGDYRRAKRFKLVSSLAKTSAMDVSIDSVYGTRDFDVKHILQFDPRVEGRCDRTVFDKENFRNERAITCKVNASGSARIQEDKLHTIVNNLINKNYPQEYITKVIQMFGYGTDVGVSSSNTDSDRLSDRTIFNRIATSVEKVATYGNYENVVKNANRCRSKDRLTLVTTDKTESLDRLKNDVYLGIPVISLEKVMQNRRQAPSSSPYKRKHKRKSVGSNRNKYNTTENLNIARTSRFADPMQTLNCSNKSDSNYRESRVYINEGTTMNFPIRKRKVDANNTKRMEYDAIKRPKPISPFRSSDRTRKFNINKENEYYIESDSSITEDETESPLCTDDDAGKRISRAREYVSNGNQNMTGITSARDNTEKEKKIKQYDYRLNATKNVKTTSTIINYVPRSTNRVTAVYRYPTIGNVTDEEKKSKVNTENLDSDVSISEEEAESLVDTYKRANDLEILREKNAKDIENVYLSKVVDTFKVTNSKENCRRISVVARNAAITSDNVIPTIDRNPKIFNDKSFVDGHLKKSNSDKFGTRNNPKLISGWKPKVVYKAESNFELGLIFQGKLLNEVGHIMQRKFTTNSICRRLSAVLVETTDHEFYRLVGKLNCTKHDLRKELIKHCRDGCPSKIDEFCKLWRSLQADISDESI